MISERAHLLACQLAWQLQLHAPNCRNRYKQLQATPSSTPLWLFSDIHHADYWCTELWSAENPHCGAFSNFCTLERFMQEQLK